jgi:3-hydroxyisobutyrate dehydrogenase
MKTGFIGLGGMGAPMARNLAKHGHLAAVWNRTAATAESLAAELGVDAAPSPARLAATVDAVFLCVSADADVLAVVDAILPDLRPGTVVVDFSTVSPDTEQEAAQRVRETGANYLDAPVTGGVEGARNGTLAIMVGGAAESLERVRPALEALGRRILHMGGIGAGQSAKAVNQVMCAGINQAVTEALGLGARLGLDLDKVIEICSGGAAGNWFLEKRGPTMVRGTFTPGFKLALHQKDLRICRVLAKTLDAGLETVEMTIRDYERLIEQGHGDDDISALYRLKRPDD